MLAAELKTGTKRSHTAAENTKFVGSFLRGVVSEQNYSCLLYTSPSPRDCLLSRMPSSA